MKTLLHGLFMLLCAPVFAQTSGPVIYFSDRQAGAQPDAVIGSNSNPGTLEAPKQNLAGVNVNTLPAGTRLLFARGGAWTHGNLRIANPNARADAPIVFDAYGSGPPPLITTTSGHASFEFGLNFSDTTAHEGYVFRNLTLRGPGGTTESWGFWLKGNVSHVTVENIDISGYYIAINCQAGGLNRFVTLRNNHIHENRGMGILGHLNDSLIEGNLFTTPTTTGFVHQIYLSNGNRNTVRGNRLIYDRLCTGGHITAHGLIDRLTIEDNFIQCPDATEGSWGISLSPYYTNDDSAQGFTNLIVRRNYLENVGNTAIAITAAPGVVVEDNITRLTVDRYQSSVMVGSPERPSHLGGPGTVRNNTHYGYSGGFAAPAGSTLSGNTIRSGSPSAPAAPSGVTAVGGDRQIRLDWPRVTDASSYTVQRATVPGGPYATIASRLTTLTFTDTGLVNDTTYHYVVSAANAFAGGPASGAISATPRLSPATLPEVSVVPSSVSIREEAAETTRFVITRRDTNATALTVRFTFSGTAQAGADYAASTSTGSVGVDSATVTLTAVTDALSEGDEAVVLILSADPLYTLGTTSLAQTIIKDRPLDGWRFGHFSPAQLADPRMSGHSADPDGDGRVNLLEYALGTNPLLIDGAAWQVSTTAGHLVMEYPRRPATDGVAYTPEVSSDLMNWSSGPTHVNDVLLRDLGEGFSLRRATDLTPLAEENRRFIRLRVAAQ
jgi:hypothetical protein